MKCHNQWQRQLLILSKKDLKILRKMENPQDHKLNQIRTDKEKEYGPFGSSMNKIAAAWNILLKDQLRLGIEPWQVALMYAQAKLIRISRRNFKSDSYDDAELYLLQAKELQQPIPTEGWVTGHRKWKKKK